MSALRFCIVAGAVLITTCPERWAGAEESLPPPLIRRSARPAWSPPARGAIPVPGGKPEQKRPAPVVPVRPKPPVPPVPATARRLPPASAGDPLWASSITGPRAWSPAPPAPLQWSGPAAASPPRDRTEAGEASIPQPAAEPLVPPRPAPPEVEDLPDRAPPPEPSPAPATEAAPEPNPEPTSNPPSLPGTSPAGQFWSAPGDPEAARERAASAARLFVPPARLPQAEDPYWASTITAPRAGLRAGPTPVRRNPRSLGSAQPVAAQERPGSTLPACPPPPPPPPLR